MFHRIEGRGLCSETLGLMLAAGGLDCRTATDRVCASAIRALACHLASRYITEQRCSRRWSVSRRGCVRG
jgi:hypothetical protein